MLQCVEYSWRGVTLREMRSPFILKKKEKKMMTVIDSCVGGHDDDDDDDDDGVFDDDNDFSLNSALMSLRFQVAW